VNEETYYDAYQAALIALQMDDRDLYRRFCRMLADSIKKTDEPIAQHFAAWTAALAPEALDDFTTLMELARSSVERDPTDRQYLTGLGAILMRAGRYDEALTRLEESDNLNPSDKTSSAYSLYFRAMTLNHLERFDEARKALADANVLAEKELNGPMNLPVWNRKLTLELLRQEATRMAMPQSSVPSPN
jgi:tetratricopeptide (TPR) repeat protein